MQLALELGDLRHFAPADTTAAGRRDCYFFAVMPNETTALQIEAQARDLKRYYRLDGRVIGPARYHVSLCGWEPPAGTEAAVVERLLRAGTAISANAFALRFDQVLSFSEKARLHPLVLSSSDSLPALNALWAALGAGMTETGMAAPHSFTPHVTLLYDRTLIPPTATPQIIWTAHDFVLLRSRRGQSRYDYLQRWPLRPIVRLATGLT